MKLIDKILGWLLKIIKSEKPLEDIIAYNFGIFETEKGYSLYLIGSSEFDETDPDWACEESFVPKNKYLDLPSTKYKLGNWDDALNEITNALKECLNNDKIKNSFICKATAITVGFDDGELIRIV